MINKAWLDIWLTGSWSVTEEISIQRWFWGGVNSLAWKVWRHLLGLLTNGMICDLFIAHEISTNESTNQSNKETHFTLMVRQVARLTWSLVHEISGHALEEGAHDTSQLETLRWTIGSFQHGSRASGGNWTTLGYHPRLPNRGSRGAQAAVPDVEQCRENCRQQWAGQGNPGCCSWLVSGVVGVLVVFFCLVVLINYCILMQ